MQNNISAGIISSPEQLTLDPNMPGGLPYIAHGFSFRIECSEGHGLAPFIPPEIYTKAFSEGFVPIADKYQKMRTHDEQHEPTYRALFESPTFAWLAKTSASNSVGENSSLKMCRTFAGSMDLTVDYYQFLLQGNSGDHQHEISCTIKDLIGLLGSEFSDEDKQEIKDAIWEQLKIDQLNQKCIDQSSIKNTRIKLTELSLGESVKIVSRPKVEV